MAGGRAGQFAGRPHRAGAALSRVGLTLPLGLASLQLPLYIQLAEAQAKLATLSCSGGVANQTASLDVLPSIGHVSIATVDPATLKNFSVAPVESTAQIATALVGLTTVGGTATIPIGGATTTWQRVPFTATEIAARTVKTASTADATTTAVASLTGKIKLQATLLGAVVPLSPLPATAGAALTPVAPVLDTLVNQLTGLLGVHLGQADVRIDGVRCGKPTLVA